MLKQEIRQKYLSIRKGISLEEKKTLEEKIFNNIKKIDFNKFNFIHIFLPIQRFNEIDTFQIIDWLQIEFPNVKIVIPKLLNIELNKELKMDHILYKGKENLIVNSWGIPEPSNNDRMDLSKIDLVFVPMVICDKKGNRVGYGKGFYDYFLKEVKEDCKKVGLSFFDPINLITDRHDYDVKLDLLISPNEIIYFEKPL